MFVARQSPITPAALPQRNAAQLRAAAMATGTFENYVGDGASVPWEIATYGDYLLGYTLWAYKSILDARWPEAFKLHDWLYTPYGRLINATRIESDDALYEEIARDSLLDASIVYAAVRAGGAPFFGVSQTGYSGILSQLVVPDIAARQPQITLTIGPPGPARSNLVAAKIVQKFQGFTTRSPAIPVGGGGLQQHGFGFTESFWWPGSVAGATTNWLAGTAQARAALLPSNTTLQGATIYDGATGAATFVPAFLPGTEGPTDQCNVALLCASNNPAAAAQSRFWIHDLPDDMVTGGEYTPSFQFASKVGVYLRSLSTFMFNAQSRGSQVSIFKILSNGQVVTNAPHAFTVGNKIEIRRAYIGNGQRVGGTFVVSTIGPLATDFAITGWTRGDARGGQAFIKSVGLQTLTACSAIRAGTRRCGRPFGEYRGRKSARKHPLST